MQTSQQMSEQMPTHAWTPPEVVDGYRLLRPIGRGGMGQVYLGYEGTLARNVALKFLSPDILREPGALERFRIEARAIARIQHPNVVTIYRVGEARGQPYIAYEFVRGRTLQTAVEMPWQQVLSVAIGCVRGLAAAHRRGVLHRDIKPSNIVVCDETGEPKLIDFGIAKLHESSVAVEVIDDASNDATPPPEDVAETTGVIDATSSIHTLRNTSPITDTSRTDVSTILGTPYYLAPERWRGLPSSERSDLYSLGVVLYDLCLGRTSGGQKRALVSVELHDLLPEVPEIFATLVDRCVKRTPGDRPESADALVQQLLAAKTTLMRLGLFRETFVGEDAQSGATDLVQRSFARIADRADRFTADFYAALFAREPSLRQLFPADMRGQQRKLLEAMQVAIDGLRTPEQLDPILEHIGRRHAAYGARPSHFDVVGEALLATLKAADSGFDAATARAWEGAYKHIASVMRRGLEGEKNPDAHTCATRTSIQDLTQQTQ